MIGLDTNVLVRYVTQDDPRQSPKATQLVEALTPQEPGSVPVVVAVELVWVLSSCYSFTREQLVQVLDTLLRSREIVMDRADQVLRALRVFSASTADFADCLIAVGAAHAGCDRTMTFDTGAAKAAGMTLVR